jgi:hypothetical protein
MRRLDYSITHPWILHFDKLFNISSLWSQSDDLASQRICIDGILCLFTGTCSLVDGHYVGQLDADGCGHDSSFEAGLFSLVYQCLSADNIGLDDYAKPSIPHGCQ